MTNKLRPITKEEWVKFEWIEVTTLASPVPIYIRGIKKPEPPDDGYVYIFKRFGTPDLPFATWSRIYTIEAE